MRIFSTIVFLPLSGLLSIIPLELSAGIREDAEAVIRQFHPGSTVLNFESLPLDHNTQAAAEQSAGQAFLLDKLFYWEIRANKAVLGYAVLDNVMGKAQPITYLVLFTPDLKVQSVRVIRYREQYGGAIQEHRWLEQFRGRDRHSGFAPGRHIDGISGATISVNAISRGIKRINVYLSLLTNDAVAADTE